MRAAVPGAPVPRRSRLSPSKGSSYRVKVINELNVPKYTVGSKPRRTLAIERGATSSHAPALVNDGVTEADPPSATCASLKSGAAERERCHRQSTDSVF